MSVQPTGPKASSPPVTEPPSGCLLVAKVGRAHGLRGELRLFPTSGDPDRLLDLHQVWLVDPRRRAPTQHHEIDEMRIHGPQVLVMLSDISDRTAALELTHRLVWARPEELPEWGEDEFGLTEITGMTLLDGDEVVGPVTGLAESAGRDLFEVDHQGRTVLVPAVKDWLVEFDRDGRRIVMNLPAGLLDPEET